MLNRGRKMNLTFEEIRNSAEFGSFLSEHSLALPSNFKLNHKNQARIKDLDNNSLSVLLTFHDLTTARDGKPFVRVFWFNGKGEQYFTPQGFKKISAAEKKRYAEEAKKRAAWLKEQELKNAKRSHEEFLAVGVPCKYHKYLEVKNVHAYYGVRYATQTITEIVGDEVRTRIAKGDLLIPIISLDKQFKSYQRIDAKGKKLLCRDSSKHKGMFPIGAWNSKTTQVILCEGYATGATLHEATGKTVFVCFDIGNIAAVAKELAEKHPHVEVILASDYDLEKEQAGLINALLLSQQFNFKFVFPNTVKKGSDWNDLLHEQGLEACNDLFYSELQKFEHQSNEDIIKSYYPLLIDKNLAKVA